MSLTNQANVYYQLISQGVPAAQAYAQAFPEGLPTAEDRARAQAKEQQKAQLGQLVGALGGAVGTYQLAKHGPALMSKLGGLFSGGASGASQAVSGVGADLAGKAIAGQAASGAGAGAPSAISGLSSALGTVAPLAAVGHGAYTAGKFLKGDDLSTGEKLAYALPTAGLSLFSDSIQDALGLGRKTTKEYQQERKSRLAEENPLYADYLTRSEQFADSNKINQALAQESTPAGFKGYWDNPETEENDMIWVNKQIKSPDRWNEEFFGSLGSGDVLHNMWFYENIPGYGDMSMQEKATIADKALQSGTATGHKGMINFDIDPNVLMQENQAPVVNTRPYQDEELQQLLALNTKQGPLLTAMGG